MLLYIKGDFMNPYKILGVSSDATLSECKKAYRKLCAKYHPDSGNGDVHKFNEVTMAWNMIQDGTAQKVMFFAHKKLRHNSLFSYSIS